MINSYDDLWPKEFKIEDQRTPLIILREQATLLGPKTNNIVEAKVQSSSSSSGLLQVLFDLVAPALNNYRIRLFTVFHPIEIFPLLIRVEKPTKEIRIEGMDDFVVAVREILSGEETIKIIKALILQSTS